MQNWIVYAFISMFFAGFTSVIAKKGLVGISGDMGVVIRTMFVFVMMLGFGYFVIPHKDWTNVKLTNWLWLGGSAITTTLSWIFYYRAIDIGQVSTVALIDKGSVVVAVALAFFLLGEAITLPKAMGALLIVAGLLVIAKG